MTNRQEVKVQTRGPDEGNPTPRKQGRRSGEPGLCRGTGLGGPVRGRLVEVVGARRDPNRVKRREASALGRLAPSSESPIFVGNAGVWATGRCEVCGVLPSEICRVPPRGGSS